MAGGKTSTDSPFAQTLADLSKSLFQESDPTRRMILNTTRGILGGHLFGAGTTPLIQSGVGAARQAAGGALTSAEGAMAEGGVSSSPFAAAIRGMIGEQGRQAIADVPMQIADKFIGMGGSMSSNIGGQALSGLSSAMAGKTTTTTTPGFLDYLSVGASAAGAMAG